MKKVLIITLEFPPQIGGIATYVHDLADALDPLQTVVLAPFHKDWVSFDSKQTYKVIRKKLLYPKFIWPRWLRMCWHIWRIIKKEKIEFLMIHHILPAGYPAIINKFFRRVPFLLFSHGTDLVAGTRTKWKRKMVKMVGEKAEQIIFNSNSLRNRFLRVLPEFEIKSFVLYPCPNEDFLQPPSEELLDNFRAKYALEGKKIMLSISRLTDGKGFPHLIRMMPEILQKVSNLVWFIIGDGPKKELLVQQIQKNNLQNVVRFLGELPHEELKPFYYLSDLFVLLTHPDEGKEEGLGLVFLEAAASGLPVVAGRSGGVEEAVLHEQTGFVFDIHTHKKQIVEAIIKVLSDEQSAKQMGDKAKERIKIDFVWKEQFKKIESWII